MVAAKSPFFIRFAADRLPTTVDRTLSNPGPADGTYKTGYTYASAKIPSLVLVPETTAPDRTGQVGLYFRSININLVMGDFKVLLSSDLAPGSCQDNATLRHEINAHVVEPTKIVFAFRDVLVGRLNAVPVPTKERPQRMPPSGVARGIETTRASVQAILDRTIGELAQALFEARDTQDSPQSYALVQGQCPIPGRSGGR